jgi:hypothetical protein
LHREFVNGELKRALSRIPGKYVQFAVITLKSINHHGIALSHARRIGLLVITMRGYRDPHSRQHEFLHVSGPAKKLRQLRRNRETRRKDQGSPTGTIALRELDVCPRDNYSGKKPFNGELPKCDVGLKPFSHDLNGTPADNAGKLSPGKRQ